MLIFDSLKSNFFTGIIDLFASVWMMQQATPQLSRSRTAFGVAIVNHALEVGIRMQFAKARPNP